ncbi:MAG: hypothetical protein KJ667_07485, partial [Alphaproteobacteria bacterium]|nr:hypothetical protein [Alphaproteobacteria bacterium]
MSAEDTATPEDQLNKLYERFTKFFALLDSNQEGERAAAVHKAWKIIQEINEIEAEIYPEDQRSKLSFATVFEKAAGGGETGIPDLDDAIAANAALKESEMVALARLERVEFLYREMKKKAYTELLKDGAVNRST